MVKPRKEWAGLKTIILTRNTVTGKDGEVSTEERYFISSLPEGIEEVVRAVLPKQIPMVYMYINPVGRAVRAI